MKCTRDCIHISSILIVVMSSCVIKLFNNQQELYKTLGFIIYQSKSWHSKSLSSVKSLFFLISTMSLFISTTAFFLCEAQTADEYGISFCISLTVLVTMVNVSIVAWNIDKILMLIRNYETFIDESWFSSFSFF